MGEKLTVIRHAERPSVPLRGDANYRAIIGEDTGAGLPLRTGIQVSQPGYTTPLHRHPYAEILTVIEGRGEAWLEGDNERVALEPGTTIVVPAGRPHRFRALGPGPLVTFGIHANAKRIVDYLE